MCTFLCIHHMCHTSLDVIEDTMFRTHQIAVAHQCDPFTIDADDAMHHIPTAVHPCQHHVAHVNQSRSLQDDALLAPDDKRQHAVAIHGQRHAHAFPHQPDGFDIPDAKRV